MPKTKSRSSRGVRIGPWPGGLNETGDPSEIADTQVTKCMNMLVSDEGILIPRPGTVLNFNNLSAVTSLPTARVLYKEPGRIMVQSYSGSAYTLHLGTIGLTGANTAPFGNPTTPLRYQAALPYNNAWYFYPWDGSTGAVYSSVGTWSAPTGQPAAAPASALEFKDRCFLIGASSTNGDVNTNTIYYSKATDPSVWTAPDGGFFKVGNADPITAIIVQDDQIVIFKATATYTFSFSSDPALDGYLRVVSRSLGAYAIESYNGVIYAFNSKNLCVYSGGYFTPIGESIVWPGVTNPGRWQDYLSVSINVYDSSYLFVFVTQGTSYYDVYAMNLKTKAWSRISWNHFANVNNRPVAMYGGVFLINADGSLTRNMISKVANFQRNWGLTPKDYLTTPYSRGDQLTSSADSTYAIPDYQMETKYLDFGDRGLWKRLFSWIAYRIDNNPLTDKMYFRIVTDAASVGIESDLTHTTTYESTTKVNDRITTKSARFRSIVFGYFSSSVSSIAYSVMAASGNVYIGSWIHYFVANVEAKDNIRT